MTATTTEATVEVAPELVSIELSPTKTRIDLASPESNDLFSSDAVVYVTKNSRGAFRAAMTVEGAKLKVGQSVKATHATRKGGYGTLEVVGRLQNGRKSGQVPEGKLALRVF